MANFSGLSVGLVGLFFVTGLVIIGLSIPMIRQKVKPNLYYGFRTRKTLASEEVWYPANRYAGKALAMAGCGQILGAMWLFFVRESLLVMTLAKVGLAILVLSVVAAIIPSLLYLRQLPVDPEPRTTDEAKGIQH